MNQESGGEVEGTEQRSVSEEAELHICVRTCTLKIDSDCEGTDRGIEAAEKRLETDRWKKRQQKGN